MDKSKDKLHEVHDGRQWKSAWMSGTSIGIPLLLKSTVSHPTGTLLDCITGDGKLRAQICRHLLKAGRRGAIHIGFVAKCAGALTEAGQRGPEVCYAGG